MEINNAYPFGNFIYLCIQEVQVLIKVLVFEQALPDHLWMFKKYSACSDIVPVLINWQINLLCFCKHTYKDI